MKQYKLLIPTFILLIIFLANSCKESSQDFYLEKKNKIVGEWVVENTSTTYFINGVIEEGIPSNFGNTIIYRKDGTGEQENSLSGGLTTFEWYYQCEPEQVLQKINGIISSTNIYHIIQNNRNEQIWEYNIENPTDPQIDYIINTIKLTPVE